MRAPWISVLVVDDAIERKIREKHNLTSDQVKQAILHGAHDEARWDDSPEYGERLLVSGTTYDGVSLIAILSDVDMNDGVWELRTAVRVRRSGD
jgi:hypothetical protein